MSRVAREYMSYVAGPNNVWAIPGRLTAKFRAKWGLNDLLSDDSEKNRADNRHHAIDAFVVASTDRSLLQKVARATEKTRDRFIENMPDPYSDYSHDNIQKKVDSIVVSYKPDHGKAKAAVKRNQTVGQLHDETAYGKVSEDDKKIILSVRKSVKDLKTQKKINEIADSNIKNSLLNLIDNNPDKKIEKVLAEFSNKTGIKRVKIHVEKDKKTVIPIKNKKGDVYKYYLSGNNYCADIYCSDKGKYARKWQVEIIPMFKAHQPEFEPQWHKDNPTAKKIMRLFINDNVAWDEGEIRKINRVKKMSVDGRLFFLNPKIAKPDNEPNATSVKQLQERNARKIGIDILGRVFDPKQNENS